MDNYPKEHIPDESNLFYRVHKSFIIDNDIIPGAFQSKIDGMLQLSAEDIYEERQKVVSDLKTLTKELLKKCNPTTKIETVISELPLLRAVHQFIEQERPYMITIMTSFADTHHTQLIIALPGKYSFFYDLTHKSITKALALNSHRAVLILK